jgi:hypothetical protein
MKRLCLAACVFLLMALPNVAVQAQSKLLFPVSTSYDLDDLGLTMLIPDDWAVDDATLAFAESEDDLAAMLDGDSSTSVEGFAFQVYSSPVAQMDFEEGATLDEMMDDLVDNVGLEVQERLEFGIATYRALFLVGEVDGDPGIITAWIQDGTFVMFVFDIPSEIGMTSDVGYTWGYIVGTISHKMDRTLPESLPITIGSNDLTLYYPEDWVAGDDDRGYFAAEFQGDVEGVLSTIGTASEGSIVYFDVFDMGDQSGMSPQIFMENLVAGGSIEEPKDASFINEHLLFSQNYPALSYQTSFVDADFPVFVLMANIEGQALLFVAQSPSQADFTTFYPIFLNMLQFSTFRQ